MEIKKLIIEENDSKQIRKLKEMYNKRADQLAELQDSEIKPGMSEEEVETVKLACNKIISEANDILEMLDGMKESEVEARKKFNPLAMFTLADGGKEETRKMHDEKEIRAFQKFISSGTRGITETELRSLNLNGAAAVVPKTISDAMITDQKYSDLLHLSNISDIAHSGKLSIPIASSGTAVVHTEGKEIADGTPGIKNLELSGYEIVSLATISRAVADMATVGFTQKMMDFVSAEVVEKLEDLFINGNGAGQPTGLVNLTWKDESENLLNAVEATTSITIADIAAGLAKLPQRYARNAIILCNTKTYYDLMVTKDGGGSYIFDPSGASEKVLGKPVVLSELVPAETVFIVDPHENYVNFAAPMQVESDASSGFTKHVINIKAFATMDSAWNPAACIRVTIKQ